MTEIEPRIYRVLVSLCSVAVCFSGSFVASVMGTTQALGWPLSELNYYGAIQFAVLFGFSGGAATVFAALSFRPKPAVFLLGIGGAMTALICGIATLLLNAWSAAC